MLRLVQGLMNHQCPRLHRGSRSGFVLGVSDSSAGSGEINWNSGQVRCKSFLVHLLILENKIDFQLRKRRNKKQQKSIAWKQWREDYSELSREQLSLEDKQWVKAGLILKLFRAVNKRVTWPRSKVCS